MPARKGGVGHGHGAIAKDDNLQFADFVRPCWALESPCFQSETSGSRVFCCGGEVFLKFLSLRPSSRAMQTAEVMIEPWRWSPLPFSKSLRRDFCKKPKEQKPKGFYYNKEKGRWMEHGKEDLKTKVG